MYNMLHSLSLAKITNEMILEELQHRKLQTRAVVNFNGDEISWEGNDVRTVWILEEHKKFQGQGVEFRTPDVILLYL